MTQMVGLKAKTVLAAKRFSGFFYKVRTNCDPTKPYNKSLINLVCSVCTGKYCLRFLSHRPRSVARSVRKTSGNTFRYRPRSRLISPYYYSFKPCKKYPSLSSVAAEKTRARGRICFFAQTRRIVAWYNIFNAITLFINITIAKAQAQYHARCQNSLSI